MTLARNVIAAQANGSTITEVSSDWWGNDSTSSEVRVLPISDPGEYLDESKAPDATVDGVNATVFTNGNLSYIVTTVGVNGPCPTYYGSTSSMCQLPQEQVQVVDTSNGKAKLRGKVLLPIDPNSYFYWGGLDWYGGWYWYDWYDGAEVVQVGHDALAFRRWDPLYDASGNYVDSASDLYIVDMSNPDNPAIASTIITEDQTAWWGDMQVIGNTLYTMDYEWVDTSGNQQTVSNYLDVINLSDRSHPVVGARINVPGMLIGGSSTDPSILYTADYIWSSDTSFNTIDVVQINGTTATLLSVLTLDGYPGSVFQQGNTLYTSVEVYSQNDYSGTVELHQIDMSNPSQPTDYVSSGSSGWGWLLGVVGDRALVTSGWGGQGIDVYKLHSHAAPVYDQFLLASGWGVYSASRQGNSLFLSSGYWGVQSYQLQ
jgi:hypothetical protein